MHKYEDKNPWWASLSKLTRVVCSSSRMRLLSQGHRPNQPTAYWSSMIHSSEEEPRLCFSSSFPISLSQMSLSPSLHISYPQDQSWVPLVFSICSIDVCSPVKMEWGKIRLKVRFGPISCSLAKAFSGNEFPRHISHGVFIAFSERTSAKISLVLH